MNSSSFIASMWLHACSMLDRADGLQKQFFILDRIGQTPLWRPPVDVFESEEGVVIRAAIPDANVESFEVCLDGQCLHLSGTRSFPPELQSTLVHRLEIPFGRIERVISLPIGRFELESVGYAAGCLEVRLERIAR